MSKTYVGFGFGAIQGGLFLYEAFRSGNFKRLVVAEIMPDTVRAVREAGGTYGLNVAGADGLHRCTVEGVEILNPSVPADREKLVAAIAGADEIGTALPSVDFYEKGGAAAAAAVLADGLLRKSSTTGSPRCVVYTAENHNHAAEILVEILRKLTGAAAGAVLEHCDVLNTVIGKMSGVVTDAAQIREQALIPMAAGIPRALLVEEFNRILISRIRWADFRRGIEVLAEKDNLLAFEEAKLYGHNAVHALIGYLAQLEGCRYMSEVAGTPLIEKARAAFISESGTALCRKHKGVDALFTGEGFRAYAEDLLVRMMNPHLRDAVERVTRDPRRKLGWDDRLVGTMRLAIGQGVNPVHFADGVAAALKSIAAGAAGAGRLAALDEIWGAENSASPAAQEIRRLVAVRLSA